MYIYVYIYTYVYIYIHIYMYIHTGLQMSSKSFQPITCYQISEKGKELVKRISRKEKEAVHEFVYARGTRELLSVFWDGRQYHLTSPSGYRRKSTITEVEAVSFVSSAYIPQCLRYGIYILYIYIYIYIYIYAYTYVNVYIYICTYVYIYIHIYI
jgi:hypothetical protein